MMLKDSGARREFETGARRDISEGKGRCDLLPLDVIGDFAVYDIASKILNALEQFKKDKEIYNLVYIMRLFAEHEYGKEESMFLEVSKQFEDGAAKYGENNWKKGIPLHCYIDSAVRHYLKYLRGDTDEPHDRAFVWNLLCAIWTIKHKPELDDIELDIKEEGRMKCSNCLYFVDGGCGKDGLCLNYDKFEDKEKNND